MDNQLDFEKDPDDKINKKKIFGMMKKLSPLVSRKTLTIYKLFVTPVLDYADIIYDKPHRIGAPL